MALSDYWRVRRSNYKPLEMAQLLENMHSLAQAAGAPDVAVGWGQRSSYQTGGDLQAQITLDAGPLLNVAAPVPGEPLDVVAGMLVHEAAHAKYQSAQVNDLMRCWADRRPAEQAAIAALYGWLEDYYVDRRTARDNPLHGDYIQEARQHYDVPGAAKMMAEAVAQALDANERALAAVKLLGLMIVYGHDLPDETPTDLLAPLVAVLKMVAKLPDTPQARARAMQRVWTTLLKGLMGMTPPPPPPPTPAPVQDQAQESGGSASRAGGEDEQEDDPGQAKGGSAEDDEAEGQGNEDRNQGGTGDDEFGEQDDQPGDGQPPVPGPKPTVGDIKDTLEDHKIKAPPSLEAAIGEARRNNAEDLQQEVIVAMGAGGVADNVTIMLDAESDPQAEAEALKRSVPYREHIARIFERFQTRQTRWLRGQREGRINASRLWRGGMGRDDLMHRKETLHGSGLAVALVLDGSSSVGAARHHVIEPLAAAIVTGASRSVEVTVLSYTEFYNTVVRIMARPEWGPVMRSGVDDPRGTPSGVGLLAAGPILRRSRKHKKLVLHVTDGKPGSIGKVSGGKAVQLAEESLRREGVEVVTLVVGGISKDDLAEAVAYYEEQMGYRVWEAVENMDDVPAAVERLLAQATRE